MKNCIQKTLKASNGITLIALVITIILLLILAGISISMLSGDNSVLQRATDAKTRSDEAQIRERIQLAYHSALTKDITEKNGELTMTTLQGELDNEFKGKEVTITPSVDNKEWTIKVDNVEETVHAGKEGTPQVATLPSAEGTTPYFPSEAFHQLPGTTLDNGLVITDAVDPEDAENPGNEYVWIEVPNANLGGNPTFGPDYLTQGLTDIEITGDLTDEQKTKIEVALWVYTGTLISRIETNDNKTTYKGWIDEWYDSDGKNATVSTNINDTAGCGLTLENYNAKYKNMLKSVYNNGGFWIGRYEAGIERPEESTDEQYLALARQSHTDISASSPKAVSKIDCIPYTWVYCSEAQRLAEGAGANLMFGIQWDLTLRYLHATTAVDQAGLTSNSEGWGNYNSAYDFLIGEDAHGYKGQWINRKYAWSKIVSGYSHPNSSEKLSTGATDRNARKNIYDLAGNMREWTLEHSTSYDGGCVYRGGSSDPSQPVSYRDWSVATGVAATSSFRFTL